MRKIHVGFASEKIKKAFDELNRKRKTGSCMNFFSVQLTTSNKTRSLV